MTDRRLDQPNKSLIKRSKFNLSTEEQIKGSTKQKLGQTYQKFHGQIKFRSIDKKLDQHTQCRSTDQRIDKKMKS